MVHSYSFPSVRCHHERASHYHPLALWSLFKNTFHWVLPCLPEPWAQALTSVLVLQNRSLVKTREPEIGSCLQIFVRKLSKWINPFLGKQALKNRKAIWTGWQCCHLLKKREQVFLVSVTRARCRVRHLTCLMLFYPCVNLTRKVSKKEEIEAKRLWHQPETSQHSALGQELKPELLKPQSLGSSHSLPHLLWNFPW